MAMITRNEYGIVAVNNSVLCRMIIDHLLKCDDAMLPCNRRGKLIRKGFFTGFNEFANAIEITENNSRVQIRIYVLMQPEANIRAAAEKLFDQIEEDFEMLSLDAPDCQILDVRGSASKQVEAEEMEIVRRYE